MVNQKNYDSEFCGQVPLHQTNLVQPHGILIIVEKSTYRIIQVSENVQELLGIPAAAVVNTALADYIKPEQIQQLQERFAGNNIGKIPFTFSFSTSASNGEHLALVQAQQDYFVVEVEKEAINGEQNSFINVYQELKFILSGIEAAVTIEEASAIIVNELKRISGFDKIMVYRFDENWNGTVIAEKMEAGMDEYLGLKFPASDIPKQAREMYRKSPYRLIPDAGYAPVKLYPVINPVTHAFTDLSDTNLRSVAAVHVEYLRNMNVVASMSTRILKNDHLWGLIACHHRTPKFLSYQMCSLFELLSNVISSKITSLEHQKNFSYKSEMHQLYSTLVESFYRKKNLLDCFYQHHPEILELLKGDGVAVIFNNEIATFGQTPATADIEDIIFWLQTNGVNQLLVETNLSGAYENAEAYAEKSSGLLALPVQPDKGWFVLAFRPEAVTKVSWGGNPDEAVTFEPDNKNYHPRKSFQTWQQTVKRTAVPWTKEELEIAENFRNFIIEYTLRHL